MDNLKLELRKIKKLQQLFNDLKKLDDWKDSYVNYEESNIALAKLITTILSKVDISEFPVSRKEEILDIDDNIIKLVWRHKFGIKNDSTIFSTKLILYTTIYHRISLLTTIIEKEEREDYTDKYGELWGLENVFPLLHKFFLEFGDEYIEIKATNLLNYKLEFFN